MHLVEFLWHTYCLWACYIGEECNTKWPTTKNETKKTRKKKHDLLTFSLYPSTNSYPFYWWAGTRQNQQSYMCAQQRQFSLGIHPVWKEFSMCNQWVVKDPGCFMRTAKTLIRLGGCPGWYESLLDAMVILLVLSCCSTNVFSYFQLVASDWRDVHWFLLQNLFTKTLHVCRTFHISSKTYEWFEPRHEKTCLCYMRTTEAQISLRIRPVWSAPLLFAAWIV